MRIDELTKFNYTRKINNMDEKDEFQDEANGALLITETEILFGVVQLSGVDWLPVLLVLHSPEL